MDVTMPESGLLAWRITGWLAGGVPTDCLLDDVSVIAPVQSVRSEPDSDWQVEGPGLLPLLSLLRRTGATQVGAAFPDDGDLTGLAGPAAFNSAAIEEGQAFVVPLCGIAATPTRVGSGLTWTLHRMNRRPPGDVGEADRRLRAELNRTIEDLAGLDVASWSPGTADALLDIAHVPRWHAPPGVPDVAVRLASRAVHLREIAQLGLADTGGAISVVEINRRAAVLHRLDRAARHALGDACSADAWPEA